MDVVISQSADQVVRCPIPQATHPESERLHAIRDATLAARSELATWRVSAMRVLDRCETRLDQSFPQLIFQKRLADMGALISKQLAPLARFDGWLDRGGRGAWQQQLALSLIKLPLRVVRNILRALYHVLETLLLSAANPVKAPLRLGRHLIALAEQLAEPKMWARIGSGLLSASVGQAVVTGNPLSIIGVGIGAAMIVSGLTIGAFVSAMEAEPGAAWHAAKRFLGTQVLEIPEALLTGFCLSALIAHIQQVMIPKQPTQQQVNTFAAKYVREQNLPGGYSAGLENDRIYLTWGSKHFEPFAEVRPDLVRPYILLDHHLEFPVEIYADIKPTTAQLTVDYFHRFQPKAAFHTFENSALPTPSDFPTALRSPVGQYAATLAVGVKPRPAHRTRDDHPV